MAHLKKYFKVQINQMSQSLDDAEIVNPCGRGKLVLHNQSPWVRITAQWIFSVEKIISDDAMLIDNEDSAEKA